MAGSRIQRQKNVGAPYQTLGISLTAGDLFQQVRCRVVSFTLGDTEEDGETVVLIRASFRTYCAVFGSYNTISLSV